MNALARWWADLRAWWAAFVQAIREPFDLQPWEDSAPSDFPAAGEIPHGLDCPDTQPTSPGALDSDLGRLTP